MIRNSGIALAGILAVLVTVVPTSSAEACRRCGGGCGSRCGAYYSAGGCGYRGCGYGGCYSGCGSSCGSACGSSCGSACGNSCGGCGISCGRYYTRYDTSCYGAYTGPCSSCYSGYGYPTYGSSPYYSYSYAAPNVNRHPISGVAPGQSLANRPAAGTTVTAPVTRTPVAVQPISVESRRPLLLDAFRR